MRFARRIYLVAGSYGLIVIAPMYFMEARIGREQPPAITHPEYFYGFLGVTLAWQLLFLVMARDPVSYRPAMIPAIVEKLSFCVALCVLLAGHRIPQAVFWLSSPDWIFAGLFIAAYQATAPAVPPASPDRHRLAERAARR
jgi:hypothetical protein